MLNYRFRLFLHKLTPKFCYLIQVCCLCRRELSKVKTHGFRDKESGGICPKCLKVYYPEAYEGLKEKGELTIQEISEAEK
jgi:uncharacterized protein with PIN domain